MKSMEAPFFHRSYHWAWINSIKHRFCTVVKMLKTFSERRGLIAGPLDPARLRRRITARLRPPRAIALSRCGLARRTELRNDAEPLRDLALISRPRQSDARFFRHRSGVAGRPKGLPGFFGRGYSSPNALS